MRHADSSAGSAGRWRRSGRGGGDDPGAGCRRALVVDYAQRAAAARSRRVADDRARGGLLGFSVRAVTGWARGTRAALRPVAVTPSPALVTLPADGVVIVLPSGVRIEGLAGADVAALA